MENIKKRILVVDDETEQVDLVKKRVEVEGYDVVAAYDGEEALNRVREKRPDLIILDIMLPGMNGHEICASLQADNQFRDIPIIMLTAQGRAEDIKRGMDGGAVSYMQKPFKMEVLLGIIKGVIG